MIAQRLDVIVRQEDKMEVEMEESPQAKRRKLFTRKEALDKLEELEGDIGAAVGDIKLCINWKICF